MTSDLYLQAIERFRQLDYLGAFELLEPLIDKSGNAEPEHVRTAILALASAGASDYALELFRKFQSLLPETEEFQTVEARLLKNLASSSLAAEESTRYAMESQTRYEAIFRKTGGTYSGINAASGALFVGDVARSRQLAAEVLSKVLGTENSYWQAVTAAEAHLLLDNDRCAQELLQRALDFSPSEDQKAISYRQLFQIASLKELDCSLLESIRPGAILSYCGHLVHGVGRTAGIDPDDEDRLKEAVALVLTQRRVEHAFGALACGADIIVAEAILRRGSKLHIVLPFAANHFREISVAPAGVYWVERFDSAIGQAASVSVVVDEPRSNYDLLFRTSSRLSMGKARLLANRSGASVFQLALWNGFSGVGGSGTASDIEQWQSTGGESVVINTPVPRQTVTVKVVPQRTETDVFVRSVKCLVFADLCGFSKLSELEMTKAFPIWTERLAKILERNSTHIKLVNTWGDAVYIVVDDVLSTAECATELSRVCDRLHEEIGAKYPMAFRVSAHVAPVLETYDKILQKTNYLGMHVNIASRMEPCTPPGTVYVTEEFAACLSLEQASTYSCQYAGVRTLPKGAGAIRMYRLNQLASAT